MQEVKEDDSDGEDMQAICSSVRSQKFWKDDLLNDQELKQIANALRLRKFRKDDRIFDFGSDADEFFVIVRGQVGILYADMKVKDMKADGSFNRRVREMRQAYVAEANKNRTFVTTKGVVEKKEEEENKEKYIAERKIAERKRMAMEKNETYQKFDNLLGLEPNPIMQQCQQDLNPLYRMEDNPLLQVELPSKVQNFFTQNVAIETFVLKNKLHLATGKGIFNHMHNARSFTIKERKVTMNRRQKNLMKVRNSISSRDSSPDKSPSSPHRSTASPRGSIERAAQQAASR